MSFKTILAVLGGDHDTADLQQALALAAETEVHLSVVALQVAMAATFSDYPVDLTWLERRQSDQDTFRTRCAASRRLCEQSDVPFDFTSFYDDASFLTEELSRRAFYADLLFLGSQAAQDADLMRIVINGPLFEVSRPVLLFPQNAAATLQPRRVVVGWDNSVEAVHAIGQALHLLKAASTVHVAMVDPESPYGENDAEPGAEVAAYLARHGVAVTVDQLPSSGRSVAEVLNRHALDVSADMMVLGAYGHSRLRQRVFGGVTRSMLESVRLPTLLAH